MPHLHIHLHSHPDDCTSTHFSSPVFEHADVHAQARTQTLWLRSHSRSHTQSHRPLHISVGDCACTHTLNLRHSHTRRQLHIRTGACSCTHILRRQHSHARACSHTDTATTICTDTRSDTLTPSHRNTSNFLVAWSSLLVVPQVDTRGVQTVSGMSGLCWKRVKDLVVSLLTVSALLLSSAIPTVPHWPRAEWTVVDGGLLSGSLVR
jgi:hypothetical protein